MNYYEEYMAGHQGEANGVHPGKRPGAMRKSTMAALVCACLIASSAAGFGGGYLAASGQTAQASAGAPSGGATASNLSAVPASSGGVMSVAQIASAASDSVVEITTEVTSGNRMMGTYTQQGAGSGVIYSQDGYIITNNHVIEGAQNITVRLKNGESYPATLVGTDGKTDLAVIKIEASGLQAVSLGDSSALQVGDAAVAIGNPLGELGGTVTNGIISALDREITLGGETMNLLQTNAAINPGNSGGGLFNAKGELVGIVVAKSSGSDVEGLGFAIPVNDVKEVVGDLIDKGYVTGRGALGISVLDINDAQTAFMYRVPQTGVYVASVDADSAAQKAGLQVGDCITSVGGAEVSSSLELKAELDQYHAGETVSIGILRNASSMDITVALQENIPENVRASVEEA